MAVRKSNRAAPRRARSAGSNFALSSRRHGRAAGAVRSACVPLNSVEGLRHLSALVRRLQTIYARVLYRIDGNIIGLLEIPGRIMSIGVLPGAARLHRIRWNIIGVLKPPCIGEIGFRKEQLRHLLGHSARDARASG